jgi:hypothetical protein
MQPVVDCVMCIQRANLFSLAGNICCTMSIICCSQSNGHLVAVFNNMFIKSLGLHIYNAFAGKIARLQDRKIARLHCLITLTDFWP